jgi:hypothetical protein
MPAPTRLLYVRPVIGNTYAAVAASTALSGWVQPAERTSSASAPVHDVAPELAGHRSESSDANADTPYEYDADHQNAWRLAAGEASRYDGPGESGVTGAAPGGLTLTHTGGMVSGSFPGDDDPFYFIDSHSYTWMPTVSYRAPSDGPWQEAWRPTWPEDAIGYEVEQYQLDDGTWSALALPVEARIQGNLVDGSVGGSFVGARTTLAVNDRIGTAVVEADGDIDFVGPPPNFNRDNALAGTVKTTVDAGEASAPSVPFDLQVTDFGNVPTRSGIVALWTSTTVPGGSDLIGDVSSWPNTGQVVVRRVVNGLAVTYTIRPPRIRWIYPSRPYRRITRRGDALAGGARRIGGRVKTIQGSNRRGAGAII